jgi:hypothetical protein
MEDSRTHWSGVYGRTPATGVSWFQPRAKTSLDLIAAAGTEPQEAVIDAGAGASVLVDALLADGYRDVTMLDVAAEALETTRNRIGERGAGRVTWVVADLLDWRPPRQFRVWHDRAVFHFLTNPADRDRYRAVLYTALAPGGHVIIGAFAQDGPNRCSGLPAARYSAEELAAEFPDCQVLRAAREQHHTPGGAIQPFTWLLLADARPTDS